MMDDAFHIKTEVVAINCNTSVSPLQAEKVVEEIHVTPEQHQIFATEARHQIMVEV